MRVQLGAPYNTYTAVLNIAAKTLTINNIIQFDLEPPSIDRVYSVTASSYLPVGFNIASVSFSYIDGVPVWVYTFKSIPIGIANSDTFVILLNIPDNNGLYSIESYIASGSVTPVAGRMVTTEGDNLISTEGDNLIYI